VGAADAGASRSNLLVDNQDASLAQALDKMFEEFHAK
jgi:hypothetical protein